MKSEFEDLVRRIKEKPISEILSHYGVKFERNTGSNLLALCPFHMDTTLGSFSANDSMGICKCFACGEGGDAIRFVQVTQNLSFQQAVLQLAADEGLISQQKFEEMGKKKYSKKFLKSMEYKLPQKVVKELTAEETTIRDDVYNALKDIFGLSEKHRKHLKEVRQLPDDRIQKDYFSFREDMRQTEVVRKILNQFPQYRDTLQDVPGFYKETGSSLPTYAVYGGGIGIFIRNARGNVVGVQIRKDIKKEGEQRYVWFSSSFAKSSKYFTGGAAAGSPQDILYPQKKKTVPCFCIAEGKFKTEILSRKGNVAMSVQGVGNFSGCEREIKEAEKRMKHKFRTFYVYYDADMFRNMAVYAQAVKLGLYLMEKFPDAEVKYGVWDDADGKGIDDLYFAGKTDSIKSHSLSVMKETWEKKVTELMKLYGIESVNKVPKEVREDFLEDLETGLKKILL